MTFSIRPYHPSDFDRVYALWQAAMGAAWTLTPDYLRRMLGTDASQHFVAEEHKRIIGFTATGMHSSGKSGGLKLIMVSPDKQRQGIGTRLHTAAMEDLRGQKPQTIQLAHGGNERFWAGVPLDLSGAVDFFQSCGWEFTYTSYDLTQDLTTYQTPAGVLERVTQQNIELRFCTPGEIPAVIAFERRVFPSWAAFFESNAASGQYGDILAAWNGNQVVGSLLVAQEEIAALSPDGIWHKLLGDDLGTIGAVGVDESYQERGIGLALVARASEKLKSRGIKPCLIGWTYLLSFYGRLGYTPWRAYAMTQHR